MGGAMTIPSTPVPPSATPTSDRRRIVVRVPAVGAVMVMLVGIAFGSAVGPAGARSQAAPRAVRSVQTVTVRAFETDRSHGVFPGSDLHWAGYLASGGTGEFTSASTTFDVPSVVCSTSDVFSSFWAGIGGASGDVLPQDGVEVDCQNGGPFLSAWYE